MKIDWSASPFLSLSGRDVHDMLRLRVDTFVVEQQCAYPEVDGRDLEAQHIMGHSERGELIAYARLLPAGPDDLARIGRVIVRAQERGQGLAHQLMEQALEHLLATTGTRRSRLAAQAPLEGFYRRHGFERIGPDYDWDGIPHVDMERKTD
jgi:ElaA protein